MSFKNDFIEINNGKCLKLSSRQFIRVPHDQFVAGKVVPRAYVDYDLTLQSGDGGYFESSINNSFPDLVDKVNFLNKLYQCFLFEQLPHKATKLVVVGESNSGKSSWAKIFFGILKTSKIASVSKEKVFGMSMIEDDTELIFIDEWSNDTLSADNAKMLFQGLFENNQFFMYQHLFTT